MANSCQPSSYTLLKIVSISLHGGRKPVSRPEETLGWTATLVHINCVTHARHHAIMDAETVAARVSPRPLLLQVNVKSFTATFHILCFAAHVIRVMTRIGLQYSWQERRYLVSSALPRARTLHQAQSIKRGQSIFTLTVLLLRRMWGA